MEAMLAICVFATLLSLVVNTAVFVMVLPGYLKRQELKRELETEHDVERAPEEADRAKAMDEGVANLMSYAVRGMSGFEDGGAP